MVELVALEVKDFMDVYLSAEGMILFYKEEPNYYFYAATISGNTVLYVVYKTSCPPIKTSCWITYNNKGELQTSKNASSDCKRVAEVESDKILENWLKNES